MDSFELVVGEILRRKGYWVHHRYKVALTKEEKREIEIPSAPRWELDIVAYKANTNEVAVVECKSYLDSPGVRFDGVEGTNKKEEKRYKLFARDRLSSVVLNRLAIELLDAGLCRRNPKIRLWLAAGNVASEADREKLVAHFERNDWKFLDEVWLAKELRALKDAKYEDEVSSVVSKLLLR